MHIRKVICGAVIVMALGCGSGKDETSSSSGKSVPPGPVLRRENQPDIYGVTEDDPEMAKAIAEAKSTLPKFIERLSHRKTEERFAARVEFVGEGQIEEIWVYDLEISGELLTGAVGDDAYFIKDVRKDMVVSFPLSRVTDWWIRVGEKDEGLYTAKVLKSRHGE